jgi:outer membrane immunogenic protein
MTNLRWLGTDRVRFGYSSGPLLLYGTAGVAYGNVQGTIVNLPYYLGANTRAGLIYGVGIEWAFHTLWSVKAEYLRADLGTRRTYDVIGATPPSEEVSLTNITIIRAGLNYHFR